MQRKVNQSGIIQLGVYAEIAMRDLNEEQRSRYNDSKYKIYAPKWVEQCLEALSRELFAKKDAISFNITVGNKNEVVKTHTVHNPPGLTLRDLRVVARNECQNVTGEIDFKLYEMSDGEQSLGFTKEIIFSLKDLVRHCIIIGKTNARAYGGYRIQKVELKEKPEVLICDLSGLQFQQPYNTGRLLLISQDPSKKPLKKGFLDSVIYRNTVGEEPPTLEVAKQDVAHKRFIEATFHGIPVYFDQVALQKFVAQDFLLALTCLNQTATEMNKEFDFRFLRYGCGYFATGFSKEDILEPNLLQGIAQGLEAFFKKIPLEQRKIKALSLPFYTESSPAARQVKKLCSQNGLIYSFEKKDALAPSSTPGLIVATTNCADPHADLGNELRYKSVDAAIGINIEAVPKFNPILNQDMGSEYVDLVSSITQSKEDLPAESSSASTFFSAPRVTSLSTPNNTLNANAFRVWLAKQIGSMVEEYKRCHPLKLSIFNIVNITSLLDEFHRINNGSDTDDIKIEKIVVLLIKRVTDFLPRFLQKNAQVQTALAYDQKNIKIPGKHHTARMLIAILQKINKLNAEKKLPNGLQQKLARNPLPDLITRFNCEVAEKYPTLYPSLKKDPKSYQSQGPMF